MCYVLSCLVIGFSIEPFFSSSLFWFLLHLCLYKSRFLSTVIYLHFVNICSDIRGKKNYKTKTLQMFLIWNMFDKGKEIHFTGVKQWWLSFCSIMYHFCYQGYAQQVFYANLLHNVGLKFCFCFIFITALLKLSFVVSIFLVRLYHLHD